MLGHGPSSGQLSIPIGLFVGSIGRKFKAAILDEFRIASERHRDGGQRQEKECRSVQSI